MAKLYAYNTSATQIKKRYAMIGSTATQIKKKYAMIGSTATLVYSAEEYILQNGVVQSLAGGFTLYKQQYNSALNFTDGYMHIQAQNSGTRTRTYTNNQIAWGSYSKLYIKLGASDLRYSNVYFMIGQNIDIPTWWTPGDDSTYVSFYTKYISPVWSDGTVLEFDISQVTNTGIFIIATMNNVGDLYIADIWVE